MGHNRYLPPEMPFFQIHDAKVHYRDQGEGLPVIFLHGLGGDLHQPYQLLQGLEGIRFISFDYRGHGLTVGGIDRPSASMETFTKDLDDLVSHLKLENLVLGGISLGSAISLKYTINHPGSVSKLILVRPAWINRPDPENLESVKLVADHIEQFGIEEGRQRFVETAIYKDIAERVPNCAKSLRDQFSREQAEKTYFLLKELTEDAPFTQWEAVEGLQIPALILANEQDPLHPLFMGEEIAAHLNLGTFKKVTPKYVDGDRHKFEVQEHIRSFLSDK